MKKVKYYESYIERYTTIEEQAVYRYEEKIGYLEKLVDTSTHEHVNVILRKNSFGYWTSYHFESGYVIKPGYRTKNDCLIDLHKMLPVLIKRLKEDDVQEGVKRLEEYKNNILEGNYEVS